MTSAGEKRPASPSTPTLPDGEEGERLYEALKLACSIKQEQVHELILISAEKGMRLCILIVQAGED